IEDQCLVGVQPALHLFLRRTEPFEFALPPLVLGFAGLEGLLMLLFLFTEASTLTVDVQPQRDREPGGDPRQEDTPHRGHRGLLEDRKSTRLNSSHVSISYAVFCLKKKKQTSS